MEEQRIVTPNSNNSNLECNCQHNKKHDDPEFGKEHDFKRLSLILITYIFFVLALAFNSLQSIAWTPTSGIVL